MKENSIFFILQSKVIVNTIEYIFIGDEECDIEIFKEVGSAMHEVHREPQIVVYEFNTDISIDENWHEIKRLRSVLPDFISLILFSKEIGPLRKIVETEIKPIKLVEQDSFFLDNLFNEISVELKKQSVYYQM